MIDAQQIQSQSPIPSPTPDHGHGYMTPEGLSIVDARMELAASLDAAGTLSVSEVARAAGITTTRMRQMRTTLAYQSLVRRILSDAASDARTRSIATRAGRLSQLQLRSDLLDLIREQRASIYDARYHSPDPTDIAQSHPELSVDDVLTVFPDIGSLYDSTNPMCRAVDLQRALIPGASSGLLVHTQKTIGSGLAARVIEEWSLDTPLLNAQLALERQAAQEAGQWADNHVHTVQKLYIGVDMDEI